MSESETRIALQIAYDGRCYSGFAPQKNAHTVGGLLESALSRIDPAHGRVTCSSRTDAGVHALGQVASFTTNKRIDSRGWVLALEQSLPEDVSVVAAGVVPLDFDPRRDPSWKRYRYKVLQSPVANPFLAGRAYRVFGSLDLAKMEEEARCLVGEHDFAAFRASGDSRESTVRNLHEVSVSVDPQQPRLVEIVVVGNRFLYNMVRIIAGTLVDVGRGRRPPGCVERALHSKRREDLGMTAPAAGLYLEHVELQTPLSDRWPTTEDVSAAGTGTRSPT